MLRLICRPPRRPGVILADFCQTATGECRKRYLKYDFPLIEELVLKSIHRLSVRSLVHLQPSSFSTAAAWFLLAVADWRDTFS